MNLPIGIMDDEIDTLLLDHVEFDAESGRVNYKRFLEKKDELNMKISDLAYIEDMDILCYSIEGSATIFAS